MNISGNPLVSIVIPAYNQAAFLDRTIQSVLNQDYKNIQCIVVDDGSKDDSFDVAKKYCPKIMLMRQVNSGQAIALTSGFKKAQGDFIGYLSSDDTIDSRLISKLVAFIVSKPDLNPVVVFPRYRTIDQFDTILNSATYCFAGVKDMVENFRCMIGPGAVFSKSIIESCGGWNPNYRQIPDYEFWLRAASVAKFYQIDEVLASFRVHSGSQTYAKSSIDKSDESIHLVSDAIEKKLILPASARMDLFCSSAYLYSACLHVRSARFRTGLKRYIKALGYSRRAITDFNAVKRVSASLIFSLKLMGS